MTDYKKDFPLLAGSDIAYLDNAATAQRPEAVLKAVEDFYTKKNANPLRGLYELGIEATEAYEAARERVREFINAGKTSEVVFTRNSTESLNLIAYSYGLTSLKAGDEILISIDNHHSNILPWQMVSRQTGAKLVYLECQPDGSYRDEDMEALVTEKTKIAAMPQISNVLGRRNPVEKLTKLVHEKGGVIVIDAAQSAPHIPVDVQALDADFLVFSGHKLMAPMGIGVLYGKETLLDAMPPFLTGGEMIDSVSRESAVFAELPHKFEAGTVNGGGAVGLQAAIDYLMNVGFDEVRKREELLTTRAMTAMQQIPGVHIQGSDKPEEQRNYQLYRGRRTSARYRVDSGCRKCQCARRPPLRPAAFKTSGCICNSACQLCVLQYGGGHRPFCPEPERNPEENGIWRIEPFTMKY